MNRRQFLSGLSAVGTVGVAGCSGNYEHTYKAKIENLTIRDGDVICTVVHGTTDCTPKNPVTLTVTLLSDGDVISKTTVESPPAPCTYKNEQTTVFFDDPETRPLSASVTVEAEFE